jgi:hypothetical protein
MRRRYGRRCGSRSRRTARDSLPEPSLASRVGGSYCCLIPVKVGARRMARLTSWRADRSWRCKRADASGRNETSRSRPAMFNHGGKGKAAVRAPSDYRSAEHCVENQLCTPVEISGRQSLYGLRKAGQRAKAPWRPPVGTCCTVLRRSTGNCSNSERPTCRPARSVMSAVIGRVDQRQSKHAIGQATALATP